VVGLPIMGVLMIFTATNVGGQVVIWELAHRPVLNSVGLATVCIHTTLGGVEAPNH
jgi:hypothetical protein